MKKEEVLELKNLLVENEFTEINSDNFAVLEEYYPSSEIARKLCVRFDSKEMSQVLTELGYKTYHEKVGVPSNPENSAFMVKSITDEETQVVDYYIQPLWKKEVVEEINNILVSDQHFINEVMPKIKEENEKTKKEKIQEFKGLGDYVAVAITKTGFNIEKDFCVYIECTEIKNDQIINSWGTPVDDGLNEEKCQHYYEKDEITDMSPYNYIRMDLPHVNNNNLFQNRKEVLRKLYQTIKGKDVVFYNKEEVRFLKRMFEEEGIPEEHSYESIVLNDYGIMSLIDWINPDVDMKLKKVFEFYNIPPKQVENAGEQNVNLKSSHRLAQLTYRVLQNIKRDY